jgi:phosphatidylglycerophosphate synthase
MLVAKQFADFLTLTRTLLALMLIWLGVAHGASGLPVAALLLFLSWTTDALDGPIARRSRLQYNTWLGDHDLEVDMAVAAGLLAYMLLSSFVSVQLGVVYALGWALFFWRWGILRSPGMLFQAPIYAWFIWLAVRGAPLCGALLVGWILAAILLTWPRFLDEVVPGFLDGMRAISGRNH